MNYYLAFVRTKECMSGFYLLVKANTVEEAEIKVDKKIKDIYYLDITETIE